MKNPVKNVGKIVDLCFDAFKSHPVDTDWTVVRQETPDLFSLIFELAAQVPHGSRPKWIGKIVGIGRQPQEQRLELVTVQLTPFVADDQRVIKQFFIQSVNHVRMLLAVCDDFSIISVDAWDLKDASDTFFGVMNTTQFLGWTASKLFSLRENTVSRTSYYHRQRR